MNSARPDAPFMARAVEVSDYVRFSWRGDRDRPPQREWFHFVVHAPDVDVIVNFSLVERLTDGGRAMGNVLLVVRSRGDGEVLWDGDLDEHELQRGDVGTGRIRLRMGDCSLDFDDGFRIRARCRRRALSVDLSLQPLCYPCFVQNVAVGHGAVVHWMVAPRLAASGVIRWGGRVMRVEGATAYHDHNWGSFRGADLAWEWGCAFADAGDAGEPLSVVFVRVLDRIRASVIAQGLLVWEGAHRRRELRGSQVTFEADGWLRPDRALRVPRALSLLARGAATDVPARLHIRAASAVDRLDGEFVSEDVARVLVPRDTDLGTTVVHEVVGRLRMEGSLGDRRIALDAPAFCEFLGDAS